jgi:dsRNA-specific ribonuclease
MNAVYQNLVANDVLYEYARHLQLDKFLVTNIHDMRTMRKIRGSEAAKLFADIFEATVSVI